MMESRGAAELARSARQDGGELQAAGAGKGEGVDGAKGVAIRGERGVAEGGDDERVGIDGPGFAETVASGEQVGFGDGRSPGHRANWRGEEAGKVADERVAEGG